MPDRNAELLAAQRAAKQAQYDEGLARWHEQHPEENTAHLTAAAISRCSLCDDDGYRPNGTVCDHIDRSATARAGMARVRAALAQEKLL